MTEYRQSRFRPPRGAADLLLIRHGESEPAVMGKPFPMKDGHGDPALHPDGEAQARALADRLADAPLAALYVTTLRRTHQTAAPLAARKGMTPIIEADLREVCLGEWDGGLYRQKAAERDPVFLKALYDGEWGHIPGAETTAQVNERVERGLRRVAQAHPDQQVACFVHGGIIATALSLATKSMTFAFMGAANASISRLIITPDYMQVRGFNDTNHLPDHLV